MNTQLSAVDRCDRCGAQAYIRYIIKGFRLDLCAHHNRQNSQALLEKGAVVEVDNTAQLAKADS